MQTLLRLPYLSIPPDHLTTTMTTLVLAPTKNKEFCQKHRILSKTQNSGVVEITSEVITILTTLVPSEDMVLFSVPRDRNMKQLIGALKRGAFSVPRSQNINNGFFCSSTPKQ